MDFPAVDEIDLPRADMLAFDFKRGFHVLLANHLDMIDGVSDPERRAVAIPMAGQNRIDQKALAFAADTENAFHGGTVKPPGRTGVPCPSATAGFFTLRIDVGGHDIGLDAIMFGG